MTKEETATIFSDPRNKNKRSDWGRFTCTRVALRDMRNLRNACSHFEGQLLDPADYARHLTRAQTLTVALNEEPRATKACALRAELIDVAAARLDEIETVGRCSSVLQFDDEWKWEAHHEAFFIRFHEVTLAVRAWRLRWDY